MGIIDGLLRIHHHRKLDKYPSEIADVIVDWAVKITDAMCKSPDGWNV